MVLLRSVHGVEDVRVCVVHSNDVGFRTRCIETGRTYCFLRPQINLLHFAGWLLCLLLPLWFVDRGASRFEGSPT